MPAAIAIRKVDGKPGQVYYPLEKITIPEPSPKDDEVVVRIHAAALNHRDHFIRQHLYPGTTFGVPLLADGCGTVVSTGSASSAQPWTSKRVILTPGTGWSSSALGPESPTGYAILGGTKTLPKGTLAECITIPAADLEPAPPHLTDAQAAALPLTGLTAWRALVTKSAAAEEGCNVLVTGIGGGVALMALLFGVAKGVHVYVTSGSQEKIDKAVQLGAAGGVSYKEEGWEKRLQKLLPEDRPWLDAVIDGAGGDIVDRTARLLKHGGVVVSYGMTLGPKMPFSMAAVLKNVEVRGSTMGSRREFKEMVAFVSERKIVPVVSRVVGTGLEDLEQVNGLFKEMEDGRQFGKLVVEMAKGGEAKESRL